MKKLSAFLLFLISMSFVSCEDEPGRKGEFVNQILVVNEGNFNEADGTISSINPSTGVSTHDIFGSVNEGRALGDIVQSLTIHDEKGYVVVNNSNRIEVVNANTFASLYAIEDLAMPRYFVAEGRTAYVSEWVSFADPGRVSVIDLETREITKRIEVGFGAENLIIIDEKLFVSNSFTNSLSVIDLESLEVVATIDVGNSPGAMMEDRAGKLWVICAGGFDMNFNPLNDGKLIQIDPATNSLTKIIRFDTNVSSKAAMDNAGEQIYFYVGKSIYRIGIDEEMAPADPIITEAGATGFYGIGVDPETDEIYVSDAVAFSANGKVFRYNNNGALVATYAADRGPNNFVFNY